LSSRLVEIDSDFPKRSPPAGSVVVGSGRADGAVVPDLNDKKGLQP
jgi:hypothetical protein